ncbi:protein kinase domain-containing protein [Haematococcus lacustris]|uniref:Protein kinase domain-containing protein n=1 Tax=Haematococcus lacustris TaxID=44745 RepID=A0A6A0AF43_HAELA|nr:protein kinase domain-containing protein [Haematococcus lacustris]
MAVHSVALVPSSGGSAYQASRRGSSAAHQAHEAHDVSPDCMALLRSMLQRDPDKRLSLAGIMATPWFSVLLPEASHQAWCLCLNAAVMPSLTACPAPPSFLFTQGCWWPPCAVGAASL